MPTSYYNAATVSGTEDVSFKAISGQIGIDKAEGIVECFVSAIGNKDSVGDIVVPGAFSMSLKRRRPRVVWGHDWNKPIGKVLEIYEVPKTDPRLPEKMKMAGVGGLYAKVQFNLNTELGREAFANISFYGMEQEWSIGYKTLTADYDPSRQANILKEVELYEVSPVLHGANQLTGTISFKADNADVSEKGWQWVDVDEDEEKADNMATLGQAVGAALGKPVDILDVSDNMVVFQTEDNMMWRASVEVQDGNYIIGKPKKVRKVPSYVEVNEPEAPKEPQAPAAPAAGVNGTPPPPDMAVKESAEEPKGIRDDDNSVGSWATPEVALNWAKTLGCIGYHSHGGGYMPCETHEEFVAAVAKWDDNANINSHNNYLAGVEVSESKDADEEDAEPVSDDAKSDECGCTKGHGMKPYGMRIERDEDDDDDKRHLNDPMATLLMTYNNLIPVAGAGKIRSETLKLVNMMEEFLTSVRESPTVTPTMMKKDGLSGFVVELKCDASHFDTLSDVLSSTPVYAVKAAYGADIHFMDEMERDVVMEKVAYALASLDFDFDVSSREIGEEI